MAAMTHAPGSLVAARGREWVVLPASSPDLVIARPLNGDMEFVTGLLPDEIREASFPRPSISAAEIGDDIAADMLRTALRIGFTASVGPLRSLASIAVEPRIYQLVPLLLALRMDVVRLLIGDDVGIGKTIEAALIAKELLEQGEARRLTVLCPPALAEQWQAELRQKFGIEATLVLPSTVTKLERDAGYESIFDRHPHTVVSTDFIKSDRYRAQFLFTCPDLVIVDEAHTCVAADSGRRQRQQRYELLRHLASNEERHLILVTATPHSGKEEAFRDLIGLLDPALALLDFDNPRGRERLAYHFVQRRRRDIRSYLDEETLFPKDRQLRETSYRLTGSYAALNRKALAYARETVADHSTGDVRQRVRWWSALALLRSVASSPRAAAETLRARSVTAVAETFEEADQLGRASVLDLGDDTLEGIDATPGADDERLPQTARDRLLSLARDADRLEGPEIDSKLAILIKEVKALLADGYDPIVFCRFIPTAEYVAEHLSRALSRKARVEAVTGTLPPAERLARIEDLTAESGRHVLVATDCLSEGVNLQEHFQAVVHYDLAWNPTRHEQREGRVDRFGQRRAYVRAVTLYGLDNGIDGVVLDVLIRKHRTIARQIGVAVPVPDRSDRVIQAVIEGLLLRKETSDQLELDLELEQARDSLHREWESAADRESRTSTKYAQSGIKLEEVRQVAASSRAAIGGPADVARFARASLSALGGSVRAELVRTDPIVAAIGRYVVDAALDPVIPSRERPARRCGVVRTTAVTARTVLLLARYRFHLTLPGRREAKAIIAEDAQVLAFWRSAGGQRVWLPEGEVAGLLAATPDANVLPELVARNIERAVAEIDEIQVDLDTEGERLAKRLLAAHQSVRTAAGTVRRGLKVVANDHADVLGVYVYLPVDDSR